MGIKIRLLTLILLFIMLMMTACERQSASGVMSDAANNKNDIERGTNQDIDDVTITAHGSVGAGLYALYCELCHGPAGPGFVDGIGLINFVDLATLQTQIEETMPPADVTTCDISCAQKIADYIVLGQNVPVVELNDPGTVTLHRLNRAEYNNTVRELLLTKLLPANDFPADDFGYGFDNIANVLTLSPLHVELLESSATQLAGEVALLSISEPLSNRSEAETLLGTGGEAYANEWNLYNNGSISDVFQIPVAGEYEFSARVWGTQTGSVPVNMNFNLERLAVQNFDVPNQDHNPGVFKIRQTMIAGSIEFGVEFLNDSYDAATGADRNLLVDWLQVEGPFNIVTEPNPFRPTLYSCSPQVLNELACATEIIKPFVERAWRRPIVSAEIDELMVLFDASFRLDSNFDAGIALVLQAVLMSPYFIFRVELDPIASTNTPDASHPLTGQELAARLSYFLWSSMPDDELMGLANNGSLSKKTIIAEQVQRMIVDPRSQTMGENFAGQWLYIRGLGSLTPNEKIFPAWGAELQMAFEKETTEFFRDLIQSGANMQQLLLANYSFLDANLKDFYGLTSTDGSFKKTALPANRQGFLTQGSFLAVTSHATRTSIVKRGKWVLSNLLCSEPPPPPLEVIGIPPNGLTGSLRDIVEAHRANPVCASCHAVMDPIGFSLEHFDAIGAWRALDDGFVIDDTGQLPDGTQFQGAIGLAQVVVDDPRYSACIVEKLFTYALGRGIQDSDSVYLDEINSAWVADGMKFSQLASLIAQSDPFTTRRRERGP